MKFSGFISLALVFCFFNSFSGFSGNATVLQQIKNNPNRDRYGVLSLYQLSQPQQMAVSHTGSSSERNEFFEKRHKKLRPTKAIIPDFEGVLPIPLFYSYRFNAPIAVKIAESPRACYLLRGPPSWPRYFCI
jgi:hypothetical protein